MSSSSASASSVSSGIVSTVSGAASSTTYFVFGSAGSLVPVDANRSRCGRAPSFGEPLPALGVEQLPVGDVGADRDGDAEPVLELGRAPRRRRRRPSG